MMLTVLEWQSGGPVAWGPPATHRCIEGGEETSSTYAILMTWDAAKADLWVDIYTTEYSPRQETWWGHSILLQDSPGYSPVPWWLPRSQPDGWVNGKELIHNLSWALAEAPYKTFSWGQSSPRSFRALTLFYDCCHASSDTSCLRPEHQLQLCGYAVGV